MQVMTRLLIALLLLGCATSNNAEREHRNALKHHEAAQLGLAVDLYRKALSHKEKPMGAYNNLAAALHQQTLVKDARKSLKRALDQTPVTLESRLNKSLLRLEAGQYKLALKDCRSLLKQKPTHPLVNLVTGLSLVLEKVENEKALSMLKLALSSQDTAVRAQAHFARGVIYSRIKEFELAASEFQSVSRYRMDAIAHANRAIALSKLGKHEQSMQQLARAADLDSNAPQIAYLQALLLWRQKKMERANKELKRARTLTPEYAPIFELDAQMAIEKRDWKRAITALRKVLSLNNANARAQFNLGFALLENNELKAAHDAFGSAVKLDPQDAEAAHNLSILSKILALP
ncbi:MAG TPA: tetratricopeptide repeat protein [Myxococcales bacterium]|nr:tetratricopeptide repeat protein [Myxococcales bacterium]HIN85846.1 tetratricopeptide repeat protein [Myxococcales bacterium]